MYLERLIYPTIRPHKACVKGRLLSLITRPLMGCFFIGTVCLSACSEEEEGGSSSQVMNQPQLLSTYQRLATAFCQSACFKEAQVFGTEHCEQILLMDIRETLYQTLDGIERGALEVNMNAIQCGIDVLGSAMCADLKAQCPEILTPRVEPGASCRFDNECIEGDGAYAWCQVEEAEAQACSMGVCVVEYEEEEEEEESQEEDQRESSAAVGEACGSTENESVSCQRPLVCFENICTSIESVGEGSPCEESAERPVMCASGLFCLPNQEDTQSLCTQLPTVGMPCFGRGICDVDAFCDTSDPERLICRATVQDGDVCDSESMNSLFDNAGCQLTSVCMEGICKNQRFIGESCREANTFCERGTCIEGACTLSCDMRDTSEDPIEDVEEN